MELTPIDHLAVKEMDDFLLGDQSPMNMSKISKRMLDQDSKKEKAVNIMQDTRDYVTLYSKPSNPSAVRVQASNSDPKFQSMELKKFGETKSTQNKAPTMKIS